MMTLEGKVKSTIYTVFVLGVFALLSCNKSASTSAAGLVIFGSTMGTYYRVTLAQLYGQKKEVELRAIIEGRLEKVNSMMSTYRQDSEVSRFNRSGHNEWYPVSIETAKVVAEALEVFHESGGAFDITVGPLVDLWGFGSDDAAKNQGRIPNQESLDEALKTMGSQHLHVRLSPPALKKDKSELQIDLSGIAKGYAVDCLAESLQAMGITNYLVDIGGEILGSGKKAESLAWKIAIETPTVNQRGIQRILELHDRAIATSGDYRNYFEREGQRYSHEIDPQTGRPIQHRLVSVSLLDDSCMRADAWATALMVMGEQRAKQLSEAKSLSSLIIIKQDEKGFSDWESSGFKAHFPAP